MNKYKIVCMPIKVPKGIYCWCRKGMQQPICKYFENKGGHSECILGMDIPKKNDIDDGVLKSIECICLKEIKEI